MSVLDPAISNLILSTEPFVKTPSESKSVPVFIIVPLDKVSNTIDADVEVATAAELEAAVNVPSTTLATKRDSPPSVK